MKPIKNATVKLWGQIIGYVSWSEEQKIGIFQYDPEFVKENKYQVAPKEMPLKSSPYSFVSHREQEGYRGLPGLLADSLPDKYGHAVIEEWLERQGRDKYSFNPVERLCYIGSRGMGALEYSPTLADKATSKEVEIDIKELVKFANTILQKREEITGSTKKEQELTETMQQILAIGSTAGGARAKCVVAWNEKENKIISGQLAPPKGYSHWLLKLDGVDKNGDKEITDPQGYLNIEYAYHLMAVDCGIAMTRCEQLIEKDRYHFLTQRFDRTPGGEKLHMSTLHGLAHMDFNKQFVYSYESVVSILKQMIKADRRNEDIEEFYRRALFNIIGVNQDDHTKNISFVMDQNGEWFLSPAYDLSWNQNSQGWTNKHQLKLNDKTQDHKLKDLLDFAKYCGLSSVKAKKMIDHTLNVFSNWEMYAIKASLNKSQESFIEVVSLSLSKRREQLMNTSQE